MTDPLPTLRASSDRLRALVEPLAADQLEAQAYPSEWTIAQVLSHIGSGAIIGRRALDDGLVGADTPEDFAPSTWDVWNAKSPAEINRAARRRSAASATMGATAFLRRTVVANARVSLGRIAAHQKAASKGATRRRR